MISATTQSVGLNQAGFRKQVPAVRRAMVVKAAVGLTIVLGVLFVAPVVQAGWVGPVTISGPGNWLYPRVAVSGSNYVHVVWRDASASTLQYCRSTDNGSTWQAVQTLSGGTVLEPCVAASGSYVNIVFRGSSHVIYLLRSNNEGASFGSLVILGSGTTDGYEPDVAAAGAHVYVIWHSYDPQYDLYFTQSADGVNFSAPVKITNTAIEEKHAQIAAYNAGTYDNVYVAWTERSQPNNSDYANFIRSANSGVTWSAPLNLWTAPITTFDTVAIAAYSSTNVYVNRDNDPNGPPQRKSTNAGASFATATWLGGGANEQRVDASAAYTNYGCSVYRRSVSLYVSTGPGSETLIGTEDDPDIAASPSGGVMHVVSDPGGPGGAIHYYRFTSGRFIAGQSLDGVWKSDSAWGDFDGDGDLDLVICGEADTGLVTKTYENQDGTLVFRQDLIGVQNESSGCLAWGDYDGDGDLDLVVAGQSAGGPIARVYENDGDGNLTWDETQVLTGVAYASVAWGDYDLDGDLDLLVKGHDGTAARTTLYKNDPLGTLTPDASQTLKGLYAGSADWGDYDGDGDPDLIVTGGDGTARYTILYRNDPLGTLTDTGDHGLPRVALSDTAWGDIDGDGDLDVVITGEDGTNRHARVYLNDGAGNFTLYDENLLAIYRSSCALGDYDADGDLDVALCGYDGGSLYTRIYANTGTGFTATFSFTAVREGSLNWVDVDDDGGLDLFMTGADWGAKYAQVYRYVDALANTPPAAPTGLTANQFDGLQLAWVAPTDAETPSAGLYYCVRVGTTAGGDEVMSGTYGSPLMGNAGQATTLWLDVPRGRYYWSVLAIDSGLMVSEWAPEQVSYRPGDVNCDGVVNFADINPFVVALGCPNGVGWPYPNCPWLNADCNNDGNVNFADINPFVQILGGR